MKSRDEEKPQEATSEEEREEREERATSNTGRRRA